MKNIIFILVCLLSFSCSNREKKKMRIIYAKHLEWDFETLISKNCVDIEKREVFIIENPSSNNEEILELIKENEKKCLINKLYVEKKCVNFSRDYYKESSLTPIDFKEDRSGGFTDDMLEDHHDDFICQITMHKNVNILGEITIEWKNTCEKSE